MTECTWGASAKASMTMATERDMNTGTVTMKRTGGVVCATAEVVTCNNKWMAVRALFLTASLTY